MMTFTRFEPVGSSSVSRFTYKYDTVFYMHQCKQSSTYRDADKFLARPTSRCILFDGENISFDDSLVIYT
jgi:hypothetical protein